MKVGEIHREHVSHHPRRMKDSAAMRPKKTHATLPAHTWVNNITIIGQARRKQRRTFGADGGRGGAALLHDALSAYHTPYTQKC